MEALFFVGNQLIATSHTGKIGVWNAVTKHWQVSAGTTTCHQFVPKSSPKLPSHPSCRSRTSSPSAATMLLVPSSSSVATTAPSTMWVSADDVALTTLAGGNAATVTVPLCVPPPLLDVQKFPLRMKDNDLLVTELYCDPTEDSITALSMYLTPKTSKSSRCPPWGGGSSPHQFATGMNWEGFGIILRGGLCP